MCSDLERRLFEAALAYGAAHAAEVAARQAHRAAYRDTETVGTAERLRCVERLAAAWEATRAALAALHAAYAAYAGQGGAQGAQEKGE